MNERHEAPAGPRNRHTQGLRHRTTGGARVRRLTLRLGQCVRVAVVVLIGALAFVPPSQAQTASLGAEVKTSPSTRPSAARQVAAATPTAAKPRTRLTNAATAQMPLPPSAAAPQSAAVSKPGAGGLDATQRALVDRVNAYLSGMQTLVGNFVQVGPDRSRTEGQFYLAKPGRVRFEYNPPSPIELIADGQSVVVRDRKLATQDLYPLSQTPLRFLLAERIDLLKDTNLVSIHADDTFVTAVIEERQTLGGSHRLALMFGAKDFQLRQWTVTDPQGFDTTVALYNLDATKKPDPALFKINYERMLQ
jgi:outer membrane lipoprotein-sorting protein